MKPAKPMPKNWNPTRHAVAIWALKKCACASGVAYLLLHGYIVSEYLSQKPADTREPDENRYFTFGDRCWLTSVLKVPIHAPWSVVSRALWKAGVR